MKKYTNYKPSSIEWIGDIPEHWEITKTKYISVFKNGYSFKSDEWKDVGYPVLRMSNIGQDGKIKLSENNLKYVDEQSYNRSKDFLVQNGDILISMTDMNPLMLWLGSTILFELDGNYLLNQRVGIIRIKDEGVNRKYYHYVSNTDIVKNQLKESVYLNVQTNLSTEPIKNGYFPLPPIQEQHQIVQFLDEKTEIIDKLISTKERKIELLKEQRTSLINQVITKGLDPKVKMKDSGVVWIGEIPEHWGRKKIKTISTTISKGTTPSTIGKDVSDEGEIRYLKSENIVDNSISEFPQFYIDRETNEMLKRSILIEGDILFVIAGASIGKTCILPKEFSPSNTNQAVSFIRLKPNENKRFVWYWLMSSKIQEQMWVVSVQSAQPNLSMENLGNFFIPYPPTSEQNQIVEYLDKRTKEIDDLVSLEQKKVEVLKEYRQSLISEVITGKIDVRTNLN